jgi:two-component system, OmpR family, sensor histidine kinase KdpD
VRDGLDSEVAFRAPAVGGWEIRQASPWVQYTLAATAIFGVTLPLFLLLPWVGPRAIALLYLLTVVLLALAIGRGPTLLAAAMSALFWDFFFLPPVGKLSIASVEDAILLAMYFPVALVLGELTARIRAQEQARRLGEERAQTLYELTRDLAAATNLSQLTQAVVEHTRKAFDARVALLLPEASGQLSFQPQPGSNYELEASDQSAADSAYQKKQFAGKFTRNFSGAAALFLPLQAGPKNLGALGFDFPTTEPPTAQQWNLIGAFVQHVSLALDRHRLREEAAQIKLLAESERLSQTLLNSMSHEIRTPLAAIKSASGTLAEITENQLIPVQQEMIAEIQQAVERLDSLVGKVLDITRLESGRVKPKMSPCDVTDLVHVALKETKRELECHKVEVAIATGLPLVPADFVLLEQSLKNLLSNAAAHTPPGTRVQVKAAVKGNDLVLSVADRGPGIPLEALPRVFDKFYRAPGAPTGGTGLGLSLVRGFIEAQGGEVTAENRSGGGALFAIRLPLDTAALETRPEPELESSLSPGSSSQPEDQTITHKAPTYE